MFENDRRYFSEKRIEEFLRRSGSPLKISPKTFVIYKFAASAFLGFSLFVASSNILLGAGGALLGFFFLDICVKISDSSDMKNVKFELADVYDLINIQTSAGVPIGIALLEAHTTVRSKRLKKELAVLSAEIMLTNNIGAALDNFESKFKSSDIEIFVMSLKQAVLTGQSEMILDDISDSLKESNQILLQLDGGKIKSIRILIQLLMYVGILAILLYGLWIELSKAWSGMLG
jgi:tight adherence protein C